MKPMPTTPEGLATRALSDLHARSRRIPASLRLLVSRSLLDDRYSLALFRGVVEPLNDSFLSSDRRIYDRIFSYAIELAIQAFPDTSFAHRLHSLGLVSSREIQARVKKVRVLSQKPMTHLSDGPIFLLSRVTLGADIAVLSVFLQAMHTAFPEHSIHILGGAKLQQIFGGLERLHLHELNYPRHGGLKARLEAWALACEHIDRSGEGRALVLDPDSRITQLGLLPLTLEPERHRLFSAVLDLGDQPRAIAQLAAEWIARQLNRPFLSSLRPRLFLCRSDQDWADRTMRFLFPGPTRPMAISLGVGGNESKALPRRQEDEVLIQLLRSGRSILLDKGAGIRELERGEQVLELARAMSLPIYRIGDDFSAPRDLLSTSPSLVTYEGGPGRFAALLRHCAPYLGYDSLWQHVAAALGVPLVTLFQGHSTPAFAARWRPAGPGPIRVLYPQAPGTPGIPDQQLPALLLEALRQLPSTALSDEDLRRLASEQRLADSTMQDLLHRLGRHRAPLVAPLRRLYLTALPSLRAARHRFPLHRGPELARLAFELAPDMAASAFLRILPTCLLTPVGYARVRGRLSVEQTRTIPHQLVVRHRSVVLHRLRHEAPRIASGLLRATNLHLLKPGKEDGFDEQDIQWIANRLTQNDAYVGLVIDRFDASEPLEEDPGSTILREAQYLWLITESGLRWTAASNDPPQLARAIHEVRVRLRSDRDRLRRGGFEPVDRPFLGATVFTLPQAYRLYRSFLRRYRRRFGAPPSTDEIAEQS